MEYTEETSMVIKPELDPDYVVTPYLEELVNHGLAYLKVDFPIHFSGPAGIGKSALAYYVACKLGQPIIIMHGDEEFGTSDLVGGLYGFRSKSLKDQYIHSVIKKEEDVSRHWVDHRLTIACKYGFTLIYDEFTRSKPEANNVLLSILEEKLLDIPTMAEAEGNYLTVHPNFRAIFTSNPEEYAGVYKAQDALKDRLITINVGFFDKATELEITQRRSGLSKPDCAKIVDIVRAYRKEGDYKHAPTIRESIKIAKVLKGNGERPLKENQFFKKLCVHVLTKEPHIMDINGTKNNKAFKLIDELVKKYC